MIFLLKEGEKKVQMADLGETTAGLAATFHAALPAGEAPGEKKPGASAGPPASSARICWMLARLSNFSRQNVYKI